jgi:hypothetical protein
MRGHAIEGQLQDGKVSVTQVATAAVLAEFENRYPTGEAAPKIAKDTKARQWRRAIDKVMDDYEFGTAYRASKLDCDGCPFKDATMVLSG